MYGSLNCANTASDVNTTQHLQSAVRHPRLYLSIYPILSSLHLPSLILSLTHTHTQTHTHTHLYMFSVYLQIYSPVCVFLCVYVCIFFPSIPITWLRHDTTQIASSKLSAAKKWFASQYRSAIISLQHLTYCFHSISTSPVHRLPVKTHHTTSSHDLVCHGTGGDNAQTRSHLQHATTQTWCQYVISLLCWEDSVWMVVVLRGSVRPNNE